MNGLDPVAETGLVDSLLQLGKSGPVYVDADHLASAETGQLHGWLPLAAADVQNSRLLEPRKQPVGPPAMHQGPPTQFFDIQFMIDVHR
jgi:hypothetical protein